MLSPGPHNIKNISAAYPGLPPTHCFFGSKGCKDIVHDPQAAEDPRGTGLMVGA